MISQTPWKSLLLTLALVSAPLAQAEVYRWVDENGVVHFSQRPPQQGDYQEQKLRVAPPADPEAARARVDKLIERQKNAEAARRQHRKEAAEAAKKREIQQQNCNKARQHLDGLLARPRVLMRNPDGTMTRLTEEERQTRIAETRKRIEEFCQ